MEHGASSTARQGHYYVPQPMPWPIMGSLSIFLLALGGVFVMNGAGGGWVGMAGGLVSYWFFLRFGVELKSLGLLFFISNFLAALSFLSAPMVSATAER